MQVVRRKLTCSIVLFLCLVSIPLVSQTKLQLTPSSPLSHLDTATVLIVFVMSAGIFGCLFLFNWRQRPTEVVFPLWGFANLSCGCGALLFGPFAAQGPNLTTAIANGLMIAFFTLMWAGLRRFDSRPVVWPVVWLVPILVTLLFWYQVPNVDLVTWHIYAYSLVTGSLCVACFIDCWRGQREEPLVMRRLAMAAFAGAFMATAFRVCDHIGLRNGGVEMEWLNPVFAMIFLLIFLIWSQAILLMLNERYANQLLRVARLDALTGVLNRAGFRELAEAEIERCKSRNKPIWLLLFDLDHFKKVNDTYGHEAGDLLLRAFVATARATIRAGDLLSRHGGEEFCMLLSGCSRSETADIAERLKQNFQATVVTTASGQVSTTVSIGAAEVSEGRDPLRAALHRADLALYAAKEKGRNQFVFTDELEGSHQTLVH